MKKSSLATLFAGLFTAALATSTIAHDSEKIFKVKIDKDLNSATVLDLNHDGNHQIFEFSDEQLQDPDFLEAQLADLDQQTRDLIMAAINGVDLEVDHQGDGKVFVINKELHGDEGDSEQLKKVIKAKISNAISQKIIKSGAHSIQIHKDPERATQLIKRLIDNSELTPAQIDAIEQQLNTK